MKHRGLIIDNRDFKFLCVFGVLIHQGRLRLEMRKLFKQNHADNLHIVAGFVYGSQDCDKSSFHT